MDAEKKLINASGSSSPKSQIKEIIKDSPSSKSYSRKSSEKHTKISNENERPVSKDMKLASESSANNDSKTAKSNLNADLQHNHEDITLKRELLK